MSFVKTESYSVQPRKLLAATISPTGGTRVFFLLSPAHIIDGRARLFSSQLSYSAVVISISSYKEEEKKLLESHLTVTLSNRHVKYLETPS